MTALFDVILPVFLVIGFGYLVAWRGLFAPAAVDGLQRYAQNFGVPVLLFKSMAALDLSAEFDPRLLVSFYAGALASFLVGWVVARRVIGRSPEDSVAVAFACLFSNSLLLGIPIMERAYGTESLAGNFAIIALHSPMLYTLGITVMEFTRARGTGVSAGRVAGRALRGVLRTPLVIGILSGLTMNVLTMAGLVLPGGFWAAVEMIARSALPAALFALGGVLLRYKPQGDAASIALICACSLILHPALTWGLGQMLGLPVAGLRSAVVTAAMAPGVNAYLFANLYQSAIRSAASSVLIATALSILTIWGWLALLP
ncbi:AEC family transporter [Paracoccus sanguinis]|uniref:AEC family transporter n=1 Tax=Paracoccus sanguinis TaxID=1545044 RepID=UPI0014519DA1|nr:AEC family transporter [Paracoccus sanguinis]QJD15824.1 AEC family transporter [Paracoccus sanguinis]